MPIIETVLLLKLVTAGLAAFGAATIVLRVLEYFRVITWFRSRTALKQSDKDNIAYTLKQAKENGRIGVVQCIFNERTKEVIDGQQYDAEELDEDLRAVHKDKDVVIYE